MGIIIPAFYFNDCTDNLTGTPPGAMPVGTSFTAGASNADGSSASVLTALTHDVHYLVIGFCGVNSTTTSTTLADILIDPAGGTSWTNFIDDLICGTGATTIHDYYHFPIFVKSGASLGIRARTALGTSITNGTVVIWAYGNPSNSAQWWCGSGVEALGITAASSKGADLTAGNSGAFSSWTTVGTSTHPYGAVQFGVQSHQTSMTNSLGYHYQIGYSSTQLPGSPTYFTSTNGVTTMVLRRNMFNMPVWCNVASSTTWQARATCSGTAQVQNVAIYGVY